MRDPVPENMNRKVRKSKSRNRRVACVATLTAAGLSLGLVACGDNSSVGSDAQASTQGATTQMSGPTGSAGSTGGTVPGGAPSGDPGTPPELSATEEKCLTKQGVDLPESSSGGAGTGEPTDESSRPDPEEMKEAFEACGIEMPEPPSGGQGGMPAPPSGQEQPGTPGSDSGGGQRSDSGAGQRSDSGAGQRSDSGAGQSQVPAQAGQAS